MSNKIFCIGLNKTGTTSMEQYFSLLGYKVYQQSMCEQLFHNILINNLHNTDFKFVTNSECTDLFKFIDKYDFFQDVPFSLPYFYRILLEKYPNGKFIFTVRKNGEEWANSLIKFHIANFGKEIINNHEAYNINNINYYNSIIRYFFMSIGFKYEEEWYNKQKLINFYDNYINDVFRDLKDNKNVLILDINNPNKKVIIDSFLNINSKHDITFPHLFKTNS